MNSESSQIGHLNSKGLEENAWKKITDLYSIENITDSNFIRRIDDVKNYFIKPKYIIYFDSPKEIIGCNYYSIRAVYNSNIADQGLNGLSPQLSDKEQVRIRNRVQKALMKYQCPEGKLESIEWMKRSAIYSEKYYEK